MPETSLPSSRDVMVLRVGPSGREERQDVTAVEEPLEIRLQGSSFIVTMRTPGADRDLVAGFLLSERLIHGPADIRSIRHCENATEAGNVIDVMLTGAAAERVEGFLAARRLVMATSACGVCGRRSIDDLVQAIPRIHDACSVSADVITSLPARLRAVQDTFAETGGLHAAALFDRDGKLIAAAEDVGRHNAVDKVIGAQLLADAVPLVGHILLVSGRTSFEIVQKAVLGGVPVVAAISAPSSLAVELAREARLTLIGFVRGGSFNVYTEAARVES